MSLNIAETFELLFDKNNNVAYKALQELQKESAETACVYPYMDRLSDMLDSDNSYVRTRGLTLLAYNAKWDKDYKIDEIIDKLGLHVCNETVRKAVIIAIPENNAKNSALQNVNYCVTDFRRTPVRLQIRSL